MADLVSASKEPSLHSPTEPTFSFTTGRSLRSDSISSPTASIRLPLHRPRSDTPDSPAHRARGSRRHAARVASNRLNALLSRIGISIKLPRWLILALLSAALLIWWFWEVHIEIAFYPKGWIKKDIKRLEPLAGCFNTGNISPSYNLSAATGPKRFQIQAGLPLRLGMDCYDFAGTIRDHPFARRPHSPASKTIFHTYWRSDLAPFGERQAWLIRSFLATQDLSQASMTLWSNGDLSLNPWVAAFTRTYPGTFITRVVDVDHLARDTALARSSLLHQKDHKAWIDGDLVRLLVTWEYGGVWVDMDSLLTRDLSPLLDHEFVTQWDCYGEPTPHPQHTHPKPI